MVLCVVDRHNTTFQWGRKATGVVCAGDGLTGWNNHGPAASWPYPTYPRYLGQMCHCLGLPVANGGVSGQTSDGGLAQVRDYLDLFPNARYFVIGFGGNDLGQAGDVKEISRHVIANLGRMIEAVVAGGRQPILFNVPDINKPLVSPAAATEDRLRRAFHNLRLKDFCQQQGVPLADVRSHLKNEYLGDGVHPNAVGAKIIADQVFEALSAVHRKPA